MHAELVYIDYWCLEVIEAKKMSVSYIPMSSSSKQQILSPLKIRLYNLQVTRLASIC